MIDAGNMTVVCVLVHSKSPDTSVVSFTVQGEWWLASVKIPGT